MPHPSSARTQARPAGTAPGHSGTRSVVLVVVTWGDHLLHAGPLDEGRPFSLGSAPDDDVVVPAAVLGHERLELLPSRGARSPRLAVPAHAAGSVGSAGGWCSVDDHRPGSTPRSAYPPATDLCLDVDSTVQLELGAVTVLITRTALGGDLMCRGRAPWDRRLAASLAAAALLVLAVLSAAYQAIPPLGETVEPEPERAELRYVIRMADVAPAEVVEEVKPPLGVAFRPMPTPFSYPDLGCRCREHQRLGSYDSPDTDGRYGVAGPQDNPDPHIARLNGEWGPVIWHGLTYSSQGDPYAPVAPWGRDDSLGTDPLSARGAMWGEHIGDSRGDNGLGPGPLEPDGGLAKLMESEVTGSGEPGGSARVLHTDLQVEGPLKPSRILPVVAARFALFRGCYEAGLERDPGLRGRLEVQLEIRPDGSIAPARASSDEIADPLVTSCVLGAFAGLSFAGEGQGSTHVTYPLLLLPAGRESSAG